MEKKKRTNKKDGDGMGDIIPFASMAFFNIYQVYS